MSDLRCYYAHQYRLLHLIPVGIEDISFNPVIRLYHDVISHQQIEILKKMSSKNVQTLYQI